MANTLPVTEDQYEQVLAFRKSCKDVAALLKDLQKAKVKRAQQLWTPLSRQDTQIGDLPDPPQTEMTEQKLKQTHKLIGSAFKASAFLDDCHHEGIPGTEADIWSTMRSQGLGLVSLPGRPWDDKP